MYLHNKAPGTFAPYNSASMVCNVSGLSLFTNWFLLIKNERCVVIFLIIIKASGYGNTKTFVIGIFMHAVPCQEGILKMALIRLLYDDKKLNRHISKKVFGT